MQLLQTICQQLVASYRHAHFGKINDGLINAVTLSIIQPNVQPYANNSKGRSMHITLSFNQYSSQFSVTYQNVIGPFQPGGISSVAIDRARNSKPGNQAQACNRL